MTDNNRSDTQNVNVESANYSFTYSLYRIYFIFTLALAVIGTVSNTLIMKKYFDTKIGGWTSDAPFIATLFPVIVTVLALIICLSQLFILDKKAFVKSCKPPVNIATRIASAFCAFALVIVIAAQFIFTTDNLSFDMITGRMSTTGNSTAISTVLMFQIMLTATALFAAIYFVSELLTDKKSVFLGLFLLVFLCAYALRLYFDMDMIFNDPRKLLSIVASCCTLLFFVAELRFYVGRGSHRFYFIFGMMTTVTCLMSGATFIIDTVALSSAELEFHDAIQSTYYIVEFMLGIYSAVRLGSFAALKEYVPSYDEFTQEENEPSEKSESIENDNETSCEALNDTENDEIKADEKADETIEDKTGDESLADDNRNEEKEVKTEIPRQEIELIYNYLYKTVSERMKDADGNRESIDAEIKQSVVNIMKTLFEDDGKRDERIAKIREVIYPAKDNFTVGGKIIEEDQADNESCEDNTDNESDKNTAETESDENTAETESDEDKDGGTQE